MRVPDKDITKEQNYKIRKYRSNKPLDLNFIQQRLPSYYPVLNAGYVLPTIFLLSLIFIPLGIGIWLFSENIQEITIPYTECQSLENPDLTCEQMLRGNRSVEMYTTERKQNLCSAKEASANDQSCRCRMNFELDKDMNGTIYMFYALTNFNQNHRLYYKSRDEAQFRDKLGKYIKLKEPSSSCEPCAYEFPKPKSNDSEEIKRRGRGRTILPCGLQANTMFNDVIDLIHVDPERYPLHLNGESPVPLNRTGIAWESDVGKFKNPEYFNNHKHPIWAKYMKPWGWKKWIWEMDPNNKSNNGLQNEDFLVWMRTAAFPNFRKLFRIVDSRRSSFKYGLPAGNYSLFITYNYEITSFKGTKTIILSTTRMSGGKNHFLAIAYMVVGGGLMLLSFIFFGINLLTRKRDMEYKKD